MSIIGRAISASLDQLAMLKAVWTVECQRLNTLEYEIALSLLLIYLDGLGGEKICYPNYLATCVEWDELWILL